MSKPTLFTKRLPVPFTDRDYDELTALSERMAVNRCAIIRIAIREFMDKQTRNLKSEN